MCSSFSLIITTIYSVPAGTRLCTGCFTYMHSHSLIYHKFCHLYLKAAYLLIPKTWQSGFKLRSISTSCPALSTTSQGLRVPFLTVHYSRSKIESLPLSTPGSYTLLPSPLIKLSSQKRLGPSSLITQWWSISVSPLARSLIFEDSFLMVEGRLCS